MDYEYPVLALVADGAAELIEAHPRHPWADDFGPVMEWSRRVAATLTEADVEGLFEYLDEPGLQGCVPNDDEDPFELAVRMELEARVLDILLAFRSEPEGGGVAELRGEVAEVRGDVVALMGRVANMLARRGVDVSALDRIVCDELGRSA